ncbi:vWA domain-containing protein [Onishia taeanensis]
MNETPTSPQQQGDLLTEDSIQGSWREPTPNEEALKKRVLIEWQQELRNWLISYPFIAKLVMRMTLVMVVDDRVPTACTDGKRIFINARYANRCSSALRRFVLGHELYHVLLGHFVRKYGRDRLRWNLAVDSEANYRLMMDGLPLPEDAVLYPAFAGRSAEAIYQWLLGHPSPEVDTPFDRHRGELLAPASLNGSDKEMVIDPDYAPLRVDVDTARQITEEWQEAVKRIALENTAGAIPAGMQLLVDDIPAPQVHWRGLLSDFLRRHLGGSFTWNRPNRRHMAQGRYLPGRQGTAISIMVGVDTSGSVRSHLGTFLAELDALLATAERVELTLIQCDAAIQSESSLTSLYELRKIVGSDVPDSVTLCGGGGTDFRPVFDRAEAVWPDIMVYLTDGYGRAPDVVPPIPVLWAITGNGACPVSWGTVIHLKKEDNA